MLKKLSLLYIKIVPIVLVINILLQTVSNYLFINYNVIKIIEYNNNIIILIGIILLSIVFRFCIYHRIFIYTLMLYYIGQIIILLTNNVYTFIIVTIILCIMILFILLITHIYLKHKDA